MTPFFFNYLENFTVISYGDFTFKVDKILAEAVERQQKSLDAAETRILSLEKRSYRKKS